jgi:hypothetical protein
MEFKITFEPEDNYRADDAQSEEFCELLNAINRRPDGDLVSRRALAILRVLAEGAVESVPEEDQFPRWLEC